MVATPFPDDELDPLEGYRPVDVEEVLSGSLEPPQPELLRRHDGEHLLYKAKLHWVKGEPEHGKTWFALAAVAEELMAGRPVAYLDWESDARDVFGRLKYLGVPRKAFGNLRYVSVPGPVDEKVMALWEEVLFADGPLVVFDAVTEAMGSSGLDPNSNRDTQAWIQEVPRPAVLLGCTVIVIDHVVKDPRQRNSRYAIGAQHKLANTTVMYTISRFETFAPGRVGKAVVYVEKDRLGGIRRFADDRRVAIFVLDAASPHYGQVTMGVPGDREGPTKRMDEIIEHLRRDEEPTPRSKRAIRDLVGGKAATTDRAIEQLVQDGRLVEAGKRGQYPLYVLAPEEDDEDAQSWIKRKLEQVEQRIAEKE